MKILIPMLSFGNAGGMRSLSVLANEWIGFGHHVTFMVHVSSGLPYYPTAAEIKFYDDAGREVNQSVDVYRDIKKSKSIYSGISALCRAINRCSDKYDVALATFYLTAYPLWLSRIKARKFYYIQAYEPGFFKGSDRHSFLYRFLAKKSYELNLEMVVNARAYFDYHNISSARLALPPVDLSIFKPKQNPGLVEGEVIKLGMIGRSIGWKGGDYVIEAHKRLRKKYGLNKYQLHVAFDSSNLHSNSGIQTHCPRNDHELAAFYRDMDIFIAVPTLQYGAVHYPVVEALASGTPLITTGYYPSTSANSWLVLPHSAEAIATSIESIILNQELAIERSQRGLIDPNEFSSTRVAKQFISYFQD